MVDEEGGSRDHRSRQAGQAGASPATVCADRDDENERQETRDVTKNRVRQQTEPGRRGDQEQADQIPGSPNFRSTVRMAGAARSRPVLAVACGRVRRG